MAEETTFNLLISSAGRRVALLRSFRQGLVDLGLNGRVLASDMGMASAAFNDADEGFVVPPCDDESFIPELLRLCERERVHLVVPTIDPELPKLAEHRQAFDDLGTTVAVSSSEVISIGADKDATHRFLRAHSIPTVRQSTPAEVLSHPVGWVFPLVMKPRRGSASIGVRVVSDPEDLAVAGVEDCIVQELAPGSEYTVDVLVDRNERLVCSVPRRRIEVRSGEVSKGVSVREPRILAVVDQVVAALPAPFGALTIQVFLDDSTGALSVIELNPRFGGGFPLSWHAGARFPQWIIEGVAGLPSTAQSTSWRDGLVMLRWDDAVFVDAADIGLP